MNSVIDIQYLAKEQPSICIPRVFNNITEARIRQVFDDVKLGSIRKVDIIERKNEKGESFKRVFVHFNEWAWNENAQAARRKLISGKEIKIVYDNPWFWKLSASKWVEDPKKAAPAAPPQQRPRSFIDFNESSTDEFGRETTRNPNRRPDDRRPDDRRPDDRKPRQPPIAPTLSRKLALPIAPTLPIDSVLSALPIAPTLPNIIPLPCSPRDPPPPKKRRTQKKVEFDEIEEKIEEKSEEYEALYGDL